VALNGLFLRWEKQQSKRKIGGGKYTEEERRETEIEGENLRYRYATLNPYPANAENMASY